MAARRTTRRAVVSGAAGLALTAAAVGAVRAQNTRDPEVDEAEDRIALAPFAFEVGLHGEAHEHHAKLMDSVAAKLGVSREKLEQAFTEAHKEVGPPGDFLLPAPHPFGAGVLAAPPVGAVGVEKVVIGAMPSPGAAAFFVSASTDDDVAARHLGITVDQLRAEMAQTSLAGVARARGVDPKVVVDALVADAHRRIDEAKARGDLPAEQADRLKANIAQAIERMVENKPGADGPFTGARIARRVVIEKP